MTITPLAKQTAQALALSTLCGYKNLGERVNLADTLGIDPSWDLASLTPGEFALVVVCHIIANS